MNICRFIINDIKSELKVTYDKFRFFTYGYNDSHYDLVVEFDYVVDRMNVLISISNNKIYIYDRDCVTYGHLITSVELADPKCFDVVNMVLISHFSGDCFFRWCVFVCRLRRFVFGCNYKVCRRFRGYYRRFIK